ncbi:MAG: ArsR/SmtB family transcription factor [Anaerolineae bacterium]
MNQPSRPDLDRIAALSRALGHPKRLAILDLLMQGVQCNCEIAAQLGLADNLISHHMRALQEAGLVTSERDPVDARWIYYTIVAEAAEDARGLLGHFLDTGRLQPRTPACGPSSAGPGRCCP